MKRLGLLASGALLAALLLHPSNLVNAGRAVVQAPDVLQLASVHKAIEKQEAAFFVAMKHKDANALANLYDENAILVPPGRHPIRGKTAIRDFYREFNAGPESLKDEQFTPLALDVCGDFAIDVSAFAGHTQSAGITTEVFRGKNLVVWRRQPDGSWKYYRDMWEAAFQRSPR